MNKHRHKSPKLNDYMLKKKILTQENTESEVNNKGCVYKLISSIFQNNLRKEEIIKKHRPYFSLKVIPNQEIEKVYSSLEKIPVEKIDLVEEFKYKEEKFESKNFFETNSKSFGLSSFDVDLSVNIFGHKQKANYHQNENNLEMSSKKNSKIYCVHTIFISLFRTIIDFKDIKLSKQVYEELKDVENANATDKKKLLEKFVDKFGLYIPLELVIGGRMNISFDVNNEEEKNLYHNMIQKILDAKLGGGFSFLSANLDANYNNKKSKDKFSQSFDNVQNMSTKIIGGDYLFKNDLKNWIKSFNIDNLQVIEYKTLMPIYCFIPGLENKLKICLKSYDDIVLQQIYDLIENDFKKTEESLFEGSSENNNSWSVGLTKDNYNSFMILKERFDKKIIITKELEKCEKKFKNKNLNNIIYDCDELYICGHIPDGCIICGWNITTDVNSIPYKVICTWKRKKELKIIGSRFFKFKLDINLSEIKNFNKIFEIQWTLDIFYINSDFLFQIYNNPMNNNYYKINNQMNNIDQNMETIIYLQDEYKLNQMIQTKNENFNIISPNIPKPCQKKINNENNYNNYNYNTPNNFLNNSILIQQNYQNQNESKIDLFGTKINNSYDLYSQRTLNQSQSYKNFFQNFFDDEPLKEKNKKKDLEKNKKKKN